MESTEKQKRIIRTLKGMNQLYENYTAEDRQVWQILYDRQIRNIPDAASFEFIQGLRHVGFNRDRIPNFDETNAILTELTGWELIAVEGIVDDKLFFQLLSERRFPATTWLRTMEELDYLEEPDMFHDVFAHVPLLANQHFVDFLKELASIALTCLDNNWAIELLSRIYWFTVEFGLIKEGDSLRIYGAGILSSAGETKFCLGDTPPRHHYEVGRILDTGYRKDKFQEQYFVINSYEELYHSIPVIKSELLTRLQEMEVMG